MARRRAAGAHVYAVGEPGEPVPQPVLRWQREVHAHWTYDVDVDTGKQTPQQCAAAIRSRLNEKPPAKAFVQIAEHSGDE
jgi:chloramphenicol 3-O phosphotransferase